MVDQRSERFGAMDLLGWRRLFDVGDESRGARGPTAQLPAQHVKQTAWFSGIRIVETFSVEVPGK